jgi:hypothetical protein
MTYAPIADDIDQALKFEVTPISLSGLSGDPVQSDVTDDITPPIVTLNGS